MPDNEPKEPGDPELTFPQVEALLTIRAHLHSVETEYEKAFGGEVKLAGLKKAIDECELLLGKSTWHREREGLLKGRKQKAA